MKDKLLQVTIGLLLGIAVPQWSALAGHGTGRQRMFAEAAVKGLRAPGAPVLESDVGIIEKLGVVTERWNIVAAPLVRDYWDPQVSAEQWVATARDRLITMLSIAVEYDALTFIIQDDSVQSFCMKISANYIEKLEALSSLYAAVSSGDEAAVLAAQESVHSTAAETRALGTRLLDAMRPYVPAESLSVWASETAKTAAERIQPEAKKP